jgi:large subunit ribosomal protein L23
MKRLQDVIVRPIQTEKATQENEAKNVYAFEVGRDASKLEIRDAIQSLFGVKVTQVRTLVVRGKSKRFGRFYGKRANWKKALVTLNEGESINFYAGA